MRFDNGARIEKGNGRYSFFSNLHYHYRNLHRWEPAIFWMGFLMLIPWTVGDFLGNYIPSMLVGNLEAGLNLKSLLLKLALAVGALMVMQALSAVLNEYMISGSPIYREHYVLPYVEKKMKVDYETLEDGTFNTTASGAYNAIFNGRGINEAVHQLPLFLMHLLPTVVYGVYLAGVQWWFPVVAAFTVLGQVYMLKLAREKHSESFPRLSEYAKKLAYLTGETLEIQGGKDIRIFKMQKWLNRKYTENLDAMNREYYRVHRWYFLKSGVDAVLDLVRNGAIYVFLLWMTVQGELTLSEFVLFYGFTSSFSENLIQAMRCVLGFGIISNTFSSIRDYFDTEERKNKEAALLSRQELQQMKERPLTIELRKVSFRYPGAAKAVFSDLDLTIRAGENLALLGLNGAGKTTLVKLICGFYAPEKGEILINGKPIRAYDREQYFELISVLFQDYTILPMTVEENIASTGEKKLNREKLDRALLNSGFLERYSRLEKGGRSMLVREIHEDAVDFSGGEKQRMLFARALYKDAPLLILDEPTAALDPIAENELYLKLGEAAKDKTTIFISHRLSSTRFCDRIVLLENGTIVETGTHEDLLEKGGRYCELYRLQSKYYRDAEKEEKRRRIMEEA